MKHLSLPDGKVSFEVTLFEANDPSCAVLFAVGRGGDPNRHSPLLAQLAHHGFTVVAPHFDALNSPRPTSDELLLRARRLRLAADRVARPGLPIAGVGHSIGATLLIALAGGNIWMDRDHQLPIPSDLRIEKLALFSPPTGFFQAPGALDGVQTPMVVWVGSNDPITPPAQSEFLKRAMQPRVSVEVRVVEGAGHFTFMNSLPPRIEDPFANREALLADLGSSVCLFLETKT